MINYIKSEKYRLLRKKSLHIASIVCLLLIAAAATILYLLQKSDPNFPYATARFFYSNVIGSSGLIMFVGYLFNSSLTGKDTALLKNAVAFGISRHTIFWSKLILTLSYFVIISLLGVGLMIGLGEAMMGPDLQAATDFLIALVNMLPIIVSVFLFIHSLKLIQIGDAYIVIIISVLYMFSGDLLRILFRSIPQLQNIYKYAPDALLHDNLVNFMNHTVQFGYEYWIIGALLSVLALVIGVTKFGQQTID